jgi:hypothetical protein
LPSFAYVTTTSAPSAARRLAIVGPMPREPPVISAIFPLSFLDIIFFLFLKLAHLEIQPRMWAMPARLVDFASLAWKTGDLVAETEMSINVLPIFILQASPYAFGRSRSRSIHSLM